MNNVLVVNSYYYLVKDINNNLISINYVLIFILIKIITNKKLFNSLITLVI